MTVSRKPVPPSTPEAAPNSLPPAPLPLPYPVSPSSPKAIFGHTPADAAATEPPPAQFRGRAAAPPSHNSSTSDLTDGWVDGRLEMDRPSPRSAPTDAAPVSAPALAQEAGIPSMLQAGSRQPGQPLPGIQRPGAPELSGLNMLDEPAIPAPLRVTPPPQARSNNPFRSRSPSNRVPDPERLADPPQDPTWADMTATPPRISPAITPLPGSLPNPSSLSLQDKPPQQYQPYSPGSFSSAVQHQQSSTVSSMGQQSEQPLSELPSSPVVPRNAIQSSSLQHDVYSSLAELDAGPPTAQAPPHSISSLTPQTATQPQLQQPHNDFNSSAQAHHELPNNVDALLPDEWKGKAPEPWQSDQRDAGPSLQTAAPPNVESKLPPNVESQLTQANHQRGETYQVKKVQWIDNVSPDLRATPIMVQNANGPCPLLALVNALTLSTPAHVETALVEALRSREQVTLGLLLDAVFDELMSGRRGTAAQQLPDVGELYSFLLTLHTGMNVNPRFVSRDDSSENLIDGFDTPPSSVNDQGSPGGFEPTREMKLYSTFSIPLVHGWLPPRTHPAYAALKRSAATYEDAQNLMFREEELEDKLRHLGLTADEQQLLEDVSTVKHFLSSSATQLTSHGLDVVAESMAPGSVAILFRNDHFSTLYKHPRSGQLLTLVTDMGYAGHDEVVWESLVDVSGEACEFYSGDFRPVGFGNSRAPAESAQHEGHSDGFHLDARAGPSQASAADEYNLPSPRNIEQEDADLALAMQLQEEEEDRQRREAANRRQEEEAASQAYLSQHQTANNAARTGRRDPFSRAVVPNPASSNLAPRRGVPIQPPRPPVAVPVTTPATAPAMAPARAPAANAAPPAAAAAAAPPMPPPRRNDPEAGEDAPPPTYEQASRTLPYHGPVPAPQASDTYARMRASNGPPHDPYTRNRAASGYSQHRASMPGQPPPHPGTARRRASGAAGLSDDVAGGGATGSNSSAPGLPERREREREKDCIVM